MRPASWTRASDPSSGKLGRGLRRKASSSRCSNMTLSRRMLCAAANGVPQSPGRQARLLQRVWSWLICLWGSMYVQSNLGGRPWRPLLCRAPWRRCGDAGKQVSAAAW